MFEKRKSICFSLFSPTFNLATNDQWHTLKKGVPRLSVYIYYLPLLFHFLFLCCHNSKHHRRILNLPKSSWRLIWAMCAGLLCGFGNGLQLWEVKLLDMLQQMLFKWVITLFTICTILDNSDPVVSSSRVSNRRTRMKSLYLQELSYKKN